jgi:hypothetical protein
MEIIPPSLIPIDLSVCVYHLRCASPLTPFSTLPRKGYMYNSHILAFTSVMFNLDLYLGCQVNVCTLVISLQDSSSILFAFLPLLPCFEHPKSQCGGTLAKQNSTLKTTKNLVYLLEQMLPESHKRTKQWSIDSDNAAMAPSGAEPLGLHLFFLL